MHQKCLGPSGQHQGCLSKAAQAVPQSIPLLLLLVVQISAHFCLQKGACFPQRRQSLCSGLSHVNVACYPQEMHILHPPGGMSPPTAPGLPSRPWGTHSSSAKQWAAVKIHRALMMVPPQMCFPWLWMLTCHGNSPGLTCVPVPILLPVFWKDS